MVSNFKIIPGKWKACLLLMFFATPLAAQTQNTAENEEIVENEASDEIVVDGIRILPERYLPRILKGSDGQLARFEQEFCPYVAGLPVEHGSTIWSMIRANAEDFGLDVSKKDCRPNALVIFTTDAPKYMRNLRKKRRAWTNSLTPRERRLLTKDKKPFYTWHSTAIVDNNGFLAGTNLTVGNSPLSGGNPNIPRSFGGANFGAPNSIGSRIASPVINRIDAAFVVIDLSATNGMTLRQLADFASLHLTIGISNKRVESYAPNSLLNLFNVADPTILPRRMTNLDRLTAQGLYSIPVNNIDAWRQSRRIARFVRSKVEEE